MATGDWLVMLANDDELTSDALAKIAAAIVRLPELDALYADEDKLNPEVACCDTYHKPAWSPKHLESVMYGRDRAACPGLTPRALSTVHRIMSLNCLDQGILASFSGANLPDTLRWCNARREADSPPVRCCASPIDHIGVNSIA